MLHITIQHDTTATADHLQTLEDRLRNLRPVLAQIGKAVAFSTKQRFITTTSPDGHPWAPNQPSTVERYAARFSRKNKSNHAARVAAKRPLTGASGALKHTIAWQINGSTVAIGSPREYAATHQFGARKGQYGATSRGAPIPWGDIPARPFLGLSSADQANIQRLLRRHFTGNSEA